MKFTERLNRWIHPWMVKYACHSYLRKSKRVERIHPNLFAPVDPKLSCLHKKLWGRLGIKCGDRWLRLHVNLTGIQDYRFCPEDVFFARIERILNDCDQNGKGLDEKNNLLYYLPPGYEPDTLVRFVRGNFFNSRGEWISKEMAQDLISSENRVVGKPCRSSGGRGVDVYKVMNISDIEKFGTDSYVVQKLITQDEFSASFNPSSINTVRMMTLRRPWDGEIVVCRSMMRMGVSDAVVDNMMKGGLCVCIDHDGSFSRYAYDYNGKRYEEHPVTKRTFFGLKHPYYEKMVIATKEIHSRIMDCNLLSFDLVPRLDGTICCIEINATSQGITQLQYDFGGLFGDDTEQLVDWCSTHLNFDSFNHFRTWY